MSVELEPDVDRMRADLVPAPIAAVSGRIASVDTLRGLTILLMIFVNDLGPAAPAWMHHIQPPNADGMTLADVVFPAFLFIVGVSIPLALEPWSLAGQRRWKQLGHILSRTAGTAVHGLDSVERRTRSIRSAGRSGSCWRLSV